MGKRGVSRPMAMGQHGEKGREGHGMSSEQRQQMLTDHHHKTLWVYWTLILLGFWTAVAPFTFSYGIGVVSPPGGRELWLSDAARISAMTWSDFASGLLLIILGWRALIPGRPLALWLACGVGVWLNAAPLLFWAPNAFAYLNGTLVGTLVIALTILIPGMPAMISYMKMGPDLPPGWSYNPSSWVQRSIMISLGFAGWLVSRYLAAFQLGYLPDVWDPFFGEGSRKILTSKMSESLPISDGGLGALAYTMEFLMGWMGSQGRWRTMPWMVTFFGILVIPLGLVHIFLVASQPVMVGYWCTFCLLAAAIMLPMIPLQVDEVIAMSQFMVQAKREGKPFWRTFWKGDTVEGKMDERSPAIAEFPKQPWRLFRASLWGMTFPWTLLVSVLLGAWLMGAPALFEAIKPMADVEHISGALIVTISVIAMGEPVRVGRYLNVAVGLAVGACPFLLTGASSAGRINDLLVGLAVIALSLPRGKIRESFGAWDRFVR
ncbi:vitamin K epoxide reductase family protein [Desulfuromonas sp. TF]|uniref:vitamin K epoxide reductase family protein n=1 Tax=Desulfuromonas sp. TF TaxID=1232410 RepID=UPI000484C9C9